MTHRERLALTLNHHQPDRVPVDFGSTAVTGISAQVVYQLRQALGLDEPDTPVKVTEPYQMLGEVGDDLREALGLDTVGLGREKNLFGFALTDWKSWKLFDGTPVLVPGAFNTEPEPDGDLLMYPEGDRSAPPSGRMPRDGYYFDSIIRQEPIIEDRLDPADNLEEFQPISDEELERLAQKADRLYTQTPYALVANFGGTGFGDIAHIPAPGLRHPKGIRDVAEWYMSLAIRQDYVGAVFERQCAIALANLGRIAEVVGDRVHVIMVTGTDFGTQRGPFAPPATYHKLFQPFHTEVNRWIHEHTSWKTFIHTCGSVEALLEDFIAAGFDILNPVQCSAADMDPRHLKAKYGDRLTFWGAAIDTQKTLPFGTPEEVRAEVRERLDILAPGGGFVFNAIHNIQPKTPIENVLAMFDALREFAG